MVDNLTGQVIRDNRYELQVKIGEGGSGIVFLAHDASLNREVAIKIATAEQTHNLGLVGVLQNEARILSQFMQYNIVPVYDYWQDQDGSTCLVMPYYPNGSLKDYLTKNKLSSDETLRLLNHIANALFAAHELNIVHRDVKPGNIMLDNKHNAYLGDFGLAKQIDPNAALDSNQVGTTSGTPGYMSPEQAIGGSVSPQSDLFSLGMTLYECLAGQHPYAKNLFAYLSPDVELPPIQTFNPELPEAINAVLRKAMAFKPEDRYADVLKFAQAFADALKLLETVVSLDADDFTCNRVFISYQRKSSMTLAWMIHTKLQENGIDCYLDVKREDSKGVIGAFERGILREIEGRELFVCILGDKTLGSEWVQKEIKHAYDNKKPMIPVFQESYRRPKPLFRTIDSSVDALLRYQGFEFFDQKGKYLDTAIADLTDAICNRATIALSEGQNIPPIIKPWMWMSSILVVIVFLLGLFLRPPPPLTPTEIKATEDVALRETVQAATAKGILTSQAIALLETDQAATTRAVTFTDTPSATSTSTASPTEDLSATVNAQMTLDAQIAVANTHAAVNAQMTLDAQAIANLPTNTPVPTTTPLPTDMPSVIPSPTFTPTPTATFTPTSTPSATYTETLTNTPTPSETLTLTPTSVLTNAPTVTDTAPLTASQSTMENITASPTPTLTPSPTLIPANGKGNIRRQIGTSGKYADIEVLSIPCALDTPECPNKVIYISIKPASNGLYKQCYDTRNDSTVCPIPDKADATGYSDLTKSEEPVKNVTWQMANTFCVAVGGRLPTQKEWESATLNNSMSTLVQEWTETRLDETKPIPTQNSEDTLMIVMPGSNEAVPANEPNPTRGFRCVFRGE